MTARSKLSLADAALAAFAARRLVGLLQDDIITEQFRWHFYRYFPAPGSVEMATRGKNVKRWNPTLGESEWVVDMIDVTRPPSPKYGPLLDPTGKVVGWTAPTGSWVGTLFNCPKCLGVWMAAAILVARRVPGLRALAAVVAVAGITRSIDDYIDHTGGVR